MPSTSGRSFMDSINQNRGLKTGLTAGLVLLGGTPLFSIARVVMKYNAPDAKKKRNINKNLVRTTDDTRFLDRLLCFLLWCLCACCLLDEGAGVMIACVQLPVSSTCYPSGPAATHLIVFGLCRGTACMLFDSSQQCCCSTCHSG